MSSDPDAQGGLSEEERRTIAEVCDRHGFPLADAARVGDLLRLAPASVEALPNGDALGAIADELDDAGFRYVTFSIPSSESEQTESEQTS